MTIHSLRHPSVSGRGRPVPIGDWSAVIADKRAPVHRALRQFANVHGERSIIDECVFARSRNPAHRRHRILQRDRDHTVGLRRDGKELEQAPEQETAPEDGPRAGPKQSTETGDEADAERA